MSRVAIIVGMSLLLGSCAAQPFGLAIEHAPGFWWGLFHGFTMPFSMVGHLFDNSIRIYAAPNNGGWYDFGYLIGVGLFFGGGSKAT